MYTCLNASIHLQEENIWNQGIPARNLCEVLMQSLL